MEDHRIIELFFERSQEAVRELDAKYGKLLYSLSYNIVNSRQDAEECVNDTYFGVWEAIPPARPDPLPPWLCKIVRNISLNCYRKKRAAMRGSNYTVAMEEMEDCLAAEGNVEQEIEARELVKIIEDFLDTLPAENRVIFLRRYWFCDSYSRIAELTGLSEKTVSVRLTRMRKKLKIYLKEREVFL